MERFAPQSLEKYVGRMVLVEKSILVDQEAARAHRVAGTPTFVLLGPDGNEATRFFCESTAERFEARIAPHLGA